MSVHYSDSDVTLHHGDALEVARTLPDEAVNCIVTSPPYFGLRDYGVEGQYGLEETPAAYVETMRGLFFELRRVLADDGTLWLNIGDTYAGGGTNNGGYSDKSTLSGFTSPNTKGRRANTATVSRTVRHGVPAKNLLGIPWRVAFALQDDGWILRNSIIWHKPNAMPESVTDRLSKRYETVFLFSKSRNYWFDLDGIRETPTSRKVQPSDFTKASEQWGKGTGLAIHTGSRLPHKNGRNPGDVWSITTRPFKDAHFAAMPPPLAERCITAGCKPGGAVLDPFSGSGTTGMEALRQSRRYMGIDISAEYLDLSLRTRLKRSQEASPNEIGPRASK